MHSLQEVFNMVDMVAILTEDLVQDTVYFQLNSCLQFYDVYISQWCS